MRYLFLALLLCASTAYAYSFKTMILMSGTAASGSFSETNFTGCPSGWTCDPDFSYTGGNVVIDYNDGGSMQTPENAIINDDEIWIAVQIDNSITGTDMFNDFNMVYAYQSADTLHYGEIGKNYDTSYDEYQRAGGGLDPPVSCTDTWGTDEYWWMHLKNGTGGNGVFEVWNGATGTFSSSTKVCDLSNAKYTKKFNTVMFGTVSVASGGTMTIKQIHISNSGAHGDM